MYQDWLAQWQEAWPSKKKKQKVPLPLVRYVQGNGASDHNNSGSFAILQLPRGIGPRLFEEISILLSSRLARKPMENDCNDQEQQQQQHYHKQQLCVLGSPHYRAYHHNLVLLARDRNFLVPQPPTPPPANTMNNVNTDHHHHHHLHQLNVTLHCVVEGSPSKDHFQIRQGVDHKGNSGYTTDVKVLRRAPSNTAGWISLVEVCNINHNTIRDHNNDDDTTTATSPSHPKSSIKQPAPRQFRKHLVAAGHPVLGNAEGAKSFRGNSLLMAAVKLRIEFMIPPNTTTTTTTSATSSSSDSIIIDSANNGNQPQVQVVECDCESPSQFAKILDQEEYFWNQRHTSTSSDGDKNGPLSCVNAILDHNVNNTESPPLPVMPRAYVEGSVLFGSSSLRFHVSPAVMIPRQGSYTVVEEALKLWKLQQQRHQRQQFDDDGEFEDLTKSTTKSGMKTTVWDLGTGSGCLLLSLMHELKVTTASDIKGIGVDISPEALQIAKRNANTLHLDDNCQFVIGTFANPPSSELCVQAETRVSADKDDSEDDRTMSVNIVLCNPPYHSKRLGQKKSLDADTLHYEPSLALHVQNQCNISASNECDNDTNGQNRLEDLLVHYREALAGIKQRIHKKTEPQIATTSEGMGISKSTILVFEVCRDNASAVRVLMQEAGFQNLSTSRDARGCVRSVQGNLEY